MKVRVKKTQPQIDEARLLEEVMRASGLGSTTRELCKKLGYDVVACSRALGRLNLQGLVRASWVPNKSGNPAEPVQFACYTYVEPAVEPAAGFVDGRSPLLVAPPGGGGGS